MPQIGYDSRFYDGSHIEWNEAKGTMIQHAPHSR
jgi:3-mercaptopyruvate sulfurtransferase SseA